MNRTGNKTNCKPEAQVVAEARPLQGMLLMHAARQIKTHPLRLKKIAAKHGLFFRYRKDLIMPDDMVLAYIKQYQHTHSPAMLHGIIGVSDSRIVKIATANGIELKNKRKTPNRNPMRCVDGYWLKVCSGCGEEKGAEYFYADEDAKTGLASQCKFCTKIRQIGYESANPRAPRRKQQRMMAREALLLQKEEQQQNQRQKEALN